MCSAICGGELDPALLEEIEPGGSGPAARVQIYRNTTFLTLIEALKATYPVVCRLVDERFFAYAAHEYVRESLPTKPRLVEYGERFADFLAEFPACRELPYLADVARLEWAVNAALHAEPAPALDRSALVEISPGEAPHLVLAPHPSWRLFASPWPVDRIWQANRKDGEFDDAIDLDKGGVWLEVFRRHDRVVVRSLDHAGYTFREAIHRGARLETAADAALGIDVLFDLTAALGTIFEADLIVACHLALPAVNATQHKEE
jgi:hypothetical protein